MRVCLVAPIVSGSLRPYGLKPARLLCPWESPGKNIRVGGHALLQGIFPTQSPKSSALQANSWLLSHWGSPLFNTYMFHICILYMLFDTNIYYVYFKAESVAVDVLLSLSSLSCVWLFVTPWTLVCQVPLSMGFPRWEYWSGLPFPSPGNLPILGIKSTTPALEDGFFTTEPPVRPSVCFRLNQNSLSPSSYPPSSLHFIP